MSTSTMIVNTRYCDYDADSNMIIMFGPEEGAMEFDADWQAENSPPSSVQSAASLSTETVPDLIEPMDHSHCPTKPISCASSPAPCASTSSEQSEHSKNVSWICNNLPADAKKIPYPAVFAHSYGNVLPMTVTHIISVEQAKKTRKIIPKIKITPQATPSASPSLTPSPVLTKALLQAPPFNPHANTLPNPMLPMLVPPALMNPIATNYGMADPNQIYAGAF